MDAEYVEWVQINKWFNHIAPWEIFECWFFSKSTFLKNSFRNTIRVSNSLDPYQAWHFVRPDLGPNCLQRLSADNIRRQRYKYRLLLKLCKRFGPRSGLTWTHALWWNFWNCIFEKVNFQKADYKKCAKLPSRKLKDLQSPPPPPPPTHTHTHTLERGYRGAALSLVL